MSESPVAQPVKNLPAMWETWIQSLGWQDSPEKGKATHSSTLDWRIPWTIWKVRGVAKSRTQLSNSHFHFPSSCDGLIWSTEYMSTLTLFWDKSEAWDCPQPQMSLTEDLKCSKSSSPRLSINYILNQVPHPKPGYHPAPSPTLVFTGRRDPVVGRIRPH